MNGTFNISDHLNAGLTLNLKFARFDYSIRPYYPGQNIVYTHDDVLSEKVLNLGIRAGYKC